MMKLHIKKGDKVAVLSGKDVGKEGEVLNVIFNKANPSRSKVIVQGINVCTKHKKPRGAGQPGGILKQESPIYACKVIQVCKKCSAKTRTARKVLSGGEIVRICKKCGEEL